MPTVTSIRETSDKGTVRASAILTLAYVPTTTVEARTASHVEYTIDFTLGGGGSTGLQWTAAHSHDGTTWEYLTEDLPATSTTVQLQRTITTSVTGLSIKLKATRRFQRLEVRALTSAVGTLCAVRAATIDGGA